MVFIRGVFNKTQGKRRLSKYPVTHTSHYLVYTNILYTYTIYYLHVYFIKNVLILEV